MSVIQQNTISTNSITEATSANGVSIDGLKIKDYSLMYGSNTGLTVSSNGYVTKPNQPAFCVRGSGSQTIANNNWIKIQFTDKTSDDLFDTTGDFNTGTHLFNCPVSGVYQFNIAVALDNPRTAADFYALQISAGGNTYSYFAMLFDYGRMTGDPSYGHGSGSIILDLTAGDDVFWNIYQAAGTASTTSVRGSDSYFSGFLIG